MTCCRHRVGQLARRIFRTLERRRIGVGNREGVQRRIHVARIERKEPDAFGGELRILSSRGKGTEITATVPTSGAMVRERIGVPT